MVVLLLTALPAIIVACQPTSASSPPGTANIAPGFTLTTDTNAGTQPPSKPTILSASKEVAEGLKNLVEAGGIIVGGFWTWMLFIKKREKFPRAELTHAITHRVLPGEKKYLRLDVKIANKGEVLLSLESGKVWVQQILPLQDEFLEALQAGKDLAKPGATEYEWPIVAERETDWTQKPIDIEPGEVHPISYDLIVDADARTVEIYTYFKNCQRKDREIGWVLTSLYDLDSNARTDTLPRVERSRFGVEEERGMVAALQQEISQQQQRQSPPKEKPLHVHPVTVPAPADAPRKQVNPQTGEKEKPPQKKKP